LLPIWVVWRRRKDIAEPNDRVVLSALSLVVAISLIDQLPNGPFNSLPYLFAGALLGVTRGVLAKPVSKPRKLGGPRMVRRPRDDASEPAAVRRDPASRER
jgi:hypothetical protein